MDLPVLLVHHFIRVILIIPKKRTLASLWKTPLTYYKHICTRRTDQKRKLCLSISTWFCQNVVGALPVYFQIQFFFSHSSKTDADIKSAVSSHGFFYIKILHVDVAHVIVPSMQKRKMSNKVSFLKCVLFLLSKIKRFLSRNYIFKYIGKFRLFVI